MGGCGGGNNCGCNGSRPEPRHWRSLEELADTPEARSFREREFPVGASELPEEIDRRSLVQILGASLSLAGLAACRRPVETIVPFVTPPEDLVPGMPKRYATTMPLGLAAYGLVVESSEGRPTKIEGNELHPSTRGAASALMQAAILDLYDPDRSAHVLQNGERRTWADFLAAWKALETEHLASGGAGLAVLAPPAASPTLFRLATALRARFPQMRWVSWEPVNEENALGGAAMLAGRPLRAAYDTSAAKVIVSLDADLLMGESGAVANARGFSAGRALAADGDGMNRLWVIESALTSTGASADHRLALPSGQIAAVAQALAGSGTPAGVPERWLAALRADLEANRGQSLLVAGRDQPPAVHAAALALNARLGNVGRTVTLHEPLDALLPSGADLAALVAAMGSGSVSTLVVLGGNPVYDAPADLAFADAIGKVANVIHLGHGRDETAEKAAWHVPQAHFLEAWGDARAADGTASVVQPLIAPLLGGKSALEIVAVLLGAETSGFDAVRQTWSGLDDQAFAKMLHDGLLEGSTAPAVAIAAAAALAAPPPVAGLEVVFRPSPAVHDGRFANVGWLQELPDAISKLTWGNAALVSPRTAERLRLGNEDGARLTVGGKGVDLPVWIVPGQADETVVVHLGYGRRLAGRVGSGVGSDVYPLRTSAALGFAGGATLEATGTKIRVAQTQDHGAMEGRPIVREATLEEWRRDPRFAPEMVEMPTGTPLFEQHTYDQGPQWGMTVDLNLCTGCNACVLACQSENNVPIVGAEQVRRGREMHWIRLDRYYSGSPENPEVAFQPVPCMQCENAPCEQVCPVAATVHTEDGLNAMVYNRCIGTRYCSNNCPYKVRRFNFFNYTKDTPELVKLAQNPEVTVRSRGVMEKCTYCVQRIQRARIDAKMAERPLRDGEIQTACQQTCPTQAIVFGDIRDPQSQVSERKRRSRNYELLAELGNKTRTTYLARIRNPHPDLVEA
jgi:molybdopterin-containing oxidoreductase family iron-sulfur binding subunit